MKIKFISNACCIYEHNGFKLLTDPWLTEPIFYGSWYHNPPICTKPSDVLDVDALYISHIHPDHCDPETLKHFRRDIPIITLEDKYAFCRKHLEEMGFTEIHALEAETNLNPSMKGYLTHMGPFKITMFGPFTKHPFHDCEIGNVVDSSILIEAGGKSILNTNDNTMSLESAFEYVKKYGSPTVAQLNYNAAGPYPACFDNLSIQEKRSESDRIVANGLNHMAAIAAILKPEYVMPFAGDYKLGGGLEYMNEYLGTTTKEHACEYLADLGAEVICLKENEEFEL